MDAVLGDRDPAADDLPKLVETTKAFREAMRLYPPIWAMMRRVVRDDEIGGVRLRAGSRVAISPFATHRHPDFWTDAERFDPSRFDDDRAGDLHPFAWIPFGGGPHMCLGKRFAETQVRAVMHQMLLRYRWSVPDGYEMPVQQAPISKPLDGLPIELEAL